MKRCLLFCVTISFGWAAFGEVTITNLAVAQRPGTKLVDITYDVSSSTTNTVTVWLTVSNGTMAVNATNLTGAVGPVPVGTNKQIVWDMRTDWNTNAAALSFSVWTDDGQAPCPVSKTGQTVSFRAGDDGDLETGVAWPNPRFTMTTNGTAVTVLDQLTGLEWVQVPHSLSGNSGSANWYAAVDFCNNLVYAGQSDWRLPSIRELESLVSCGTYSPALPAGHPFASEQNGCWCWSSTSYAYDPGSAWSVQMNDGSVYLYSSYDKTHKFCVWPVRGGQ
jgi:hypothetical protein